MQQLDSIVLLLQGCESQPPPPQQELQQMLVDAVCAALRTPATPASVTLQASSIGPMLQALQAHPDLCRQLQAALVDGMFPLPAPIASLLAAQTNESMQQLCTAVLSARALREKHWAAFAAAVAQRPNNHALLVHLLASPLLQEAAPMMQQLVEAVAAAVRATTSSGSGSASLLVGGWTRVLDAFPGTASGGALQAQLRRAVAETVCAHSGLLAAQSDESMLQLSAMLLSNAELQAAHYQGFAAAVLQRPHCISLLKQLLQAQPVLASATAQEQLVSAAAVAIRSWSGNWQVLQVLQVATVLKGAAQRKLQAAVAEAVLSKRALVAAQSDESMLQLSDLLLGNPQLRAAYYQRFAAAVLQRQDSRYALLKQLLLLQSSRSPGAVDAREQLVAAAAAAIRTRGSNWQLSQELTTTTRPGLRASARATTGC